MRVANIQRRIDEIEVYERDHASPNLLQDLARALRDDVLQAIAKGGHPYPAALAKIACETLKYELGRDAT